MYVLDFINKHDDWESILTKAPYCIKISRDGDYFLLKYNQLNSDFSNPIVQECRGVIFTKDKNDKYICVARAFDKFFNSGEAYAANIDWKNIFVEEKIDGSLIKFFYYDNTWHIATNGTIDAFKATVGDSKISFGDLVCQALRGQDRTKSFCETLDTNYTYMFELVSPKSKITIPYLTTKLYYLGQRDMTTMKESKFYTYAMYLFGVLCPKTYDLKTLDDCIEYTKTMTKNEEGFVIKDINFNRVKLKSPEYLIAFHCNNNGVITVKRIIDMIKQEKIDDFIAYAPQYQEQIDDVKNKINKVACKLDSIWKSISYAKNLDKKEFAIIVNELQEKDFLFKKYNNNDLNTIDYIMSKPSSKIKEMLEET